MSDTVFEEQQDCFLHRARCDCAGGGASAGKKFGVVLPKTGGGSISPTTVPIRQELGTIPD